MGNRGVSISRLPEWKIAKKISLLEIKEEVTLSELARAINVGSDNPYFRRVIDIFIKKKAIKNVRKQGANKLILLDIDNVDEILESSPIFEEIAGYIREKKNLYDLKYLRKF